MAPSRSITRESASGRTAGAALRALALRLRDLGLSGAKALNAALGLILTVALGISVLALVTFAKLAEEVLEGDTDKFDRAILAWIHAHSALWIDTAAIEATALGSFVVIVTVGMMVSVLLWHLGKQRHVALIWIASTGSLVLNQTLKTAFSRTRPDVFEWLVQVGSLSFPSGHAMNAMVFYTVTSYSIGQVLTHKTARAAIYAFAAALIVTIGFTRMYLGVHYPSDVLAGYTVGFAWATSCAILTEAWGRRAESAHRR